MKKILLKIDLNIVFGTINLLLIFFTLYCLNLIMYMKGA